MRKPLAGLLSLAAILATTACGSDGLTGPDLPEARRNVALAGTGGWSGGCRVGDTLEPVGFGNPYDENNDLSVCYTGTEYYDNRIPNEPDGGGWVAGCRAGDTMIYIGPGDFVDVDRNFDYAICSTGTRYYDNKLEGDKGGDGGGWEGGCRVGDSLIFVSFPNAYDDNGDLAICSGSRGYYDNRLPR